MDSLNIINVLKIKRTLRSIRINLPELITYLIDMVLLISPYRKSVKTAKHKLFVLFKYLDGF